MVVAEAPRPGQTRDERPAYSPTLSPDSRRGDRLSRDQTAGNLLSLLCAHRDRCHEDSRIGEWVLALLDWSVLGEADGEAAASQAELGPTTYLNRRQQKR